MTDPKPVRDRSRASERACREKVRAEGRCRACDRVPSGHPLDALNVAHLLRGAYREWVSDGVVPLCGSGSTGCHRLVDQNVGDARARLRARLTDDEIAYVERVRPGMIDVLYPPEA